MITLRMDGQACLGALHGDAFKGIARRESHDAGVLRKGNDSTTRQRFHKPYLNISAKPEGGTE